jgi:hypothetical protein
MPNEFVARNGIIALNNSSITGSLGVSGGITGSLFGTASWASNAVTSSYILNAVSASFASTASFVNPLRQNVIITGSLIITSSAVSTIAGNPTFDGDSVLTIKNNNPSSFPTQVLALDSVRSDTPVDIKLGSSTPKGIRIYADNQVLTSSPAGAGFQFYRITDTNFPGQVYFDSGAHNNAAIIFRTAITSGTITERARIASNGNFLIGTATDAGFRLDVNGTSRFQNNMNVTGSFTVITGSAVEFQVTNTGVRIGNASTDVHTVTGSFNVSGSVTATGSVNIVGSLNVNTEVQNISFYNAAGSQFIGSIGRNSAGSLNVQADLADLRLGVGGFAGNIVLDSTARAAALIRLVSTSGTIVSSSFTVFTGSAIEFQVTDTGTKIGNVITDTHTVTGSLNVSGSITTTGTITAQTLVVQTITSSTDFVTGSTRFGSLLANTHQFTGSVSITGSLTANGTSTLVGDVVFASNANSVSRMFYSSGSGLIIGTNASPAVPFAGTFLRIGAFDINGNISGIGSTSPIINVNNTNNGVGSQNTIQILENRTNFSFGNSILISGSSSNGSAQLQSGITISNIASHEYRAINITLASGSTSYGIYAGSGDRNYFSGSVSVGKIVPNAVLDVNGSTIISGSFTVFTGSAVEFQVTNTGVRIGNVTTDVHTVTGSFNVSGSVTATGNTTISGSTVITGSFTVFTGSAVEFQVTNTGVRIGNASTDTHTVTGSFNISGSGFVQGGGFIVSGTLATSGSSSQGLVAPLKFTTATANTNYTLVYTDEGKMVEMNYNVDAPLLVTIPLNSSVPFPIGTEISVIQIGGGTTVITGSSGVTVNSYLGYKTIGAQYGVASVVKRGTDSWYLFGNLS